MKIPLLLFPIIRSAIEKIDNDIKNKGLQTALATFFSGQKTKIFVKCDDQQVMDVLSREAVIVVSNHPHGIEPMALFAAMPSRSNAYVVANEQFTNISPAMDDHIIPVSIQHVLNKATTQLKRIKFVQTILPVDQIPVDAAKQKNRESIKKAQDKVAQGSLVMIFPGVEMEGPFLPGVGRIIQHMETDKKVYIVNAYVTGTSKYDFVRIIPLLRRLMPSIHVYFSEPKMINHHISNELEIILTELKNNYLDWEKSLKN